MSSDEIIIWIGIITSLAFGRLVTGPWYQIYNPTESRLLNGWPVEWESYYYTPHVKSFTSNSEDLEGLAPVHLRVLIPLGIAAMLTSVSSSLYWSFALVDLVGWAGAAFTVRILAVELGVSVSSARIATLCTVASPLFISQMWMHVFHLVEFASLPLGMLAMLRIMRNMSPIDGSARSLTNVSGVIMTCVFLEFNYVYMPVVVVVCLSCLLGECWINYESFGQGRSIIYNASTKMCIVVSGAMIAKGAATVIISLLNTSGFEARGYMDAVTQPSAIFEMLRHNIVSGQVTPFVGALGNAVRLMALSYDPIVLVLGLCGIVYSNRRIAFMGAALLSISVIAAIAYPTPWASMTAYPVIYVGVGVCIMAITNGVRGCLERATAGRALMGRSIGSSTAHGIMLLACAYVFARTNADIWGDVTFVMEWWELYAIVPRY